jgi:hypothetical protein
MARCHAPKLAPDEGAVITDTLESVAREGARAMLERALAEEVDEFLGRPRYAPVAAPPATATAMAGSARSASAPGRCRRGHHASATCRRAPSPLPRPSCPSAATSRPRRSASSPGSTSRASAAATSSPRSDSSWARAPRC